MRYVSLSLSTAEVAGLFEGDGASFADLLNELADEGPVSPTFQVEFAAMLDEGGRGLLKQLLDAVVGRDAEGR